MELLQSQVQRLSQQQLQSAELLQMSALELEAYLRDLAQENPLVDLEEPLQPEPERPREDDLLRRLRWLEDNGYNMAIEGEYPRRRIREILAES